MPKGTYVRSQLVTPRVRFLHCARCVATVILVVAAYLVPSPFFN